MRTRNEALREKNPSPGTLADESREAVGKLLSRSNKCGSRGPKKNENNSLQGGVSVSGSKRNDDDKKQDVDALMEDKVDDGSLNRTITENCEDMNDSDWEDGSIPVLDSADNNHQVTIEFNETPYSEKRKHVRRATAEEKELAEIIHKVHLLCLLGRGRLVDRACDDPLIQAGLLSLLPKHLLNISTVAKLTATDLNPLLRWLQDNFHVRGPVNAKRSFCSSLAFAIETREGSSDEIAALSVALFRALSLTTRFVSILDVASLKPDGEKSENFSPDVKRSIFSTSTLMVERQNEVSVSPSKSISPDEKENTGENPQRGSKEHSTMSPPEICSSELKDKQSCSLASEANQDLTQKSQGSKRKGDLEFELQMAMALSSTAIRSVNTEVESATNNLGSDISNLSSPFKRAKRILSEESSSSHGVSTAIGSKRVGSPLYWAEVYCSGENLTGKWVHVDVVNGIIDGEQKVEALASACKTSLRYVVAFAGNGAKDVTRRYCMQWYKIASKRVNPIWWDAVLSPLRELESSETSGIVNLDSNPQIVQNFSNTESSSRCPLVASRSSLEDVELETRALTEPLPTNQQAYRNHQLYAIEKWLSKNQILYPKGPILGFCAGHGVYPRTCVQTLQTKERWLREALQVKAGELPVKEVKRTGKLQKAKSFEEDDDYVADNSEGTLKLYGKWQLEPLQLPHAANGRVPKNDRGQVDVWSEKCLPPGTVHLRLPRVFTVAKRLEIDYAPAMVGFEYMNGQSYPVFEGIVVCSEFKDVILEGYIEEQKQKEAEEKKRNEIQAVSRWYQLLSSIVTRQRIKNRYAEGSSTSFTSATNKSTMINDLSFQISDNQGEKLQSLETRKGNRNRNKNKNKTCSALNEVEVDHKHELVTVDQCLDEDENLVLLKRCHCGFSLQVEDL